MPHRCLRFRWRCLAARSKRRPHRRQASPSSTDKAKAGKALFTEYCAGCHNAWPYRWTEANKYGKRFILVGLTPQTYVGTDRAQFDALTPVAITGELGKFLPRDFRDAPMLSKFLLNLLIGEAVLDSAVQKLKPTEAQLADM